MASRKVSPADEEYIRAHASDMSVRAIAEMIGCSKSTVQRLKRKLGCRVADDKAIEAASRVEATPTDELAILRSLASLLWSEAKVSKGNVLAKLSQEIRETLERISEIEQSSSPDEIPASNVEQGACIDAICSGIAGSSVPSQDQDSSGRS